MTLSASERLAAGVLRAVVIRLNRQDHGSWTIELDGSGVMVDRLRRIDERGVFGRQQHAGACRRYLNVGRADSALACYRTALDHRQKIVDRPGEGVTLNNIGVVYNHLGFPDSALNR